MLLLVEVLRNDPMKGREINGRNFIVLLVVGATNGRLTTAAVVRAEESNIREEAVTRLGKEKGIYGEFGIFFFFLFSILIR